jgi:Cu/Ag efflux protein CusF
MSARLILIVVLLFLVVTGCGHKPESAGPERHYPFSGKVVALDAAHQVATIDGAAIPNFMEAMTMDYPVKSKDEFNTLRVGDQITGTVNVSASGDDYSLSGIRKQAPVK